MEMVIAKVSTEGVEPVALYATCGHEDGLGYFAGTPCAKCTKAAHKKAVGK
jgi:hypothetical protein